MTKPDDFDKDFPAVAKRINDLANQSTASTARYMTWDSGGMIRAGGAEVCFNSLPNYARQAAGFGVIFQGYGGFDKDNSAPKLAGLDRWRKAVERDLYTTKAYPFVNVDGGHYNEWSLIWLEGLLDPEGPFKMLLPHLLETKPEDVQKRRCFIFPDASSTPARLAWCFAIASRNGFANARVMWRYIHMKEMGLDTRTALLIAGGFEHQVKAKELTGKIIKSYTIGCLGADVTAYAGRWLTANPVEDKGMKAQFNGTNGSSEVFRSGKIDLKNLIFDDWQSVIEYVQQRGRDQTKELKLAA